jgi:general stress protein CsbA
MTAITIYALFFDDIRILLFPKEADNFFFAATLMGIILFTAEIVATSYSKDDYINSFFFWLDIISTVSMIPDCGWIWDPYSGY